MFSSVHHIRSGGHEWLLDIFDYVSPVEHKLLLGKHLENLQHKASSFTLLHYRICQCKFSVARDASMTFTQLDYYLIIRGALTQ